MKYNEQPPLILRRMVELWQKADEKARRRAKWLERLELELDEVNSEIEAELAPICGIKAARRSEGGVQVARANRMSERCHKWPFQKLVLLKECVDKMTM